MTAAIRTETFALRLYLGSIPEEERVDHLTVSTLAALNGARPDPEMMQEHLARYGYSVSDKFSIDALLENWVMIVFSVCSASTWHHHLVDGLHVLSVTVAADQHQVELDGALEGGLRAYAETCTFLLVAAALIRTLLLVSE